MVMNLKSDIIVAGMPLDHRLAQSHLQDSYSYLCVRYEQQLTVHRIHGSKDSSSSFSVAVSILCLL